MIELVPINHAALIDWVTDDENTRVKDDVLDNDDELMNEVNNDQDHQDDDTSMKLMQKYFKVETDNWLVT